MNILPTFSSDAPPIWPEMMEKYGMRPWSEYPTLVCAYDGVIYAQSDLPADVIVHERVHLERQAEYPGGAKAYLDRYMTDRAFLLEEETIAYRTQYAYICKVEKHRGRQWNAKMRLARNLSGDIYGHVISYEEALAAISN